VLPTTPLPNSTPAVLPPSSSPALLVSDIHSKPLSVVNRSVRLVMPLAFVPRPNVLAAAFPPQGKAYDRASTAQLLSSSRRPAAGICQRFPVRRPPPSSSPILTTNPTRCPVPRYRYRGRPPEAGRTSHRRNR
jgi:hypothetical protein